MKLSELLAKPFKVKGGGTVNLKGLSKHIVDKEIGGNSDTDSDSIFNKIFGLTIIPHSSKVINDNNIIVNTPNAPDNNTYYLLYKKSEFSKGRAIDYFIYDSYNPTLHFTDDYNEGQTFNIDGKDYVTIDPNK